MGCTISIINHNNKSGKTVIAFNLASALSLYGKKTLFLTSFENYSSASSLFLKNTKDNYLFFKEKKFEKILYESFHSIVENLDFMFLDIKSLESDLEDEKSILNDFSQEIKSNYDFIIIDTSSGLTGGLDIFFGISDKYIVPLEVDDYAFDSLTPLFAKSGWMKKNNDKPEFQGFLLNKVYEKTRLYNLFSKSSFYFFGSYVLEPVIPYDRLIDFNKNESGSILDDIISIAGVSFLKLAEYIEQKNGGFNEGCK